MNVTVRGIIYSHHRRTFSGLGGICGNRIYCHSFSKKCFEEHCIPSCLMPLVQDITSHDPPLTCLERVFHSLPDLRTRKDKEAFLLVRLLCILSSVY